MNYRHLLILLFSMSCLAFDSGDSNEPENDEIEIRLTNIRSTEGYIYVFVYTYENQYPYNPSQYFKFAKRTLVNGNLSVEIPLIAETGSWALTLLDDENSNEDLDRWFGVPKEGFGFSNNVRPFFSLPEYETLIFHPVLAQGIDIEIQYVF